MTTIVTRAGKGSPLSTLELDTNFTNLNTDKVEVGGALGTPSSGTVTNLTGTASININGTVGATTPAAGAFTTLSASSPATFQAGTAALPAITTSGDTNTGLFFPAADTIAASVGGSESMRLTSTGLGVGTSAPTSKLCVIDADNSAAGQRIQIGFQNADFHYTIGRNPSTGLLNFIATNSVSEAFKGYTFDSNVGIGTSSPPGKLHLTQAQSNTVPVFSVGESSNNQRFSIFQETSFTGIVLGDQNVNLKLKTRAGGGTGGTMSFWTSPSGDAIERMRIDSAGNVGIGTTAPGTRLDVTGTAKITAGNGDQLFLDNTGQPYTQIGFGNNGTQKSYFALDNIASLLEIFGQTDIGLKFGTNSTERLRITSAGNVGINTTSPDANLTVNGAASFAAGTASLPSIARSGDLNTGIFFPAADTIAFAEGGGERVRINSVGAFKQSLDGTYLDAEDNYSEFNVNTVNKYALIVSSTNASPASTYVQDLRFRNASPNNTDARFLACTDSTEEKAAIRSNGDFTSRTNSYGGYSDIKLKENVVDASEKLTDIMQLQVRNFNFKNDPDLKQIGFIAQEFEQIFPALVTESQDRDQQGNISNETTKSIKTSVLIPILVKAMQEQQAIIQTLEQRISALETV